MVFWERNCALTISQKNSYSPFMTHGVKYLLVILTTSLNECEYTLCPWMLFVCQGTYYVCTIYLFVQENLLYFQSHTNAWLRWNSQYVFCNKNALYRGSFTLWNFLRQKCTKPKLPWLFSSAVNSQYEGLLVMYHNKPWNRFTQHDANNEFWKKKRGGNKSIFFGIQFKIIPMDEGRWDSEIFTDSNYHLSVIYYPSDCRLLLFFCYH